MWSRLLVEHLSPLATPPRIRGGVVTSASFGAGSAIAPAFAWEVPMLTLVVG